MCGLFFNLSLYFEILKILIEYNPILKRITIIRKKVLKIIKN